MTNDRPQPQGEKEQNATRDLLLDFGKTLQGVQKTLEDLVKAQNDSNIPLQKCSKSIAENTDKINMCLKENSSLRCAQVDMEERIKLLETQVINLRSEKTQREKESRQLNLIVKGLLEKDNEKVFVMMRSLIDKLGLSFSYSAMHGAYRIGGANRNAVYPRPIKWFLTTRQQKSRNLWITT